MTFQPHLTVAAVIEQNGRFLMVEENVEGHIVLNQPAGHVEAGESFIDAVIRETLEETAHPFEPQAVTGIYRWQHPDNGITFVRHAFCGAVGEPDADLELDDGILRALWLSPDELLAQRDKLRSPLVMQSIEDYLSGQRYPLKLYRDIE
ncbi:MAG: NUDIX hydrolase [Pseudomonadota bacterium]|nr:NUDIX hydrolase [Pseudomonadota bacterium]